MYFAFSFFSFLFFLGLNFIVTEGWESPKMADWLEQCVDKASHAYFGKPACCIPFLHFSKKQKQKQKLALISDDLSLSLSLFTLKQKTLTVLHRHG